MPLARGLLLWTPSFLPIPAVDHQQLDLDAGFVLMGLSRLGYTLLYDHLTRYFDVKNGLKISADVRTVKSRMMRRWSYLLEWDEVGRRVNPPPPLTVPSPLAVEPVRSTEPSEPPEDPGPAPPTPMLPMKSIIRYWLSTPLHYEQLLDLHRRIVWPILGETYVPRANDRVGSMADGSAYASSLLSMRPKLLEIAARAAAASMPLIVIHVVHYSDGFRIFKHSSRSIQVELLSFVGDTDEARCDPFRAAHVPFMIAETDGVSTPVFEQQVAQLFSEQYEELRAGIAILSDHHGGDVMVVAVPYAVSGDGLARQDRLGLPRAGQWQGLACGYCNVRGENFETVLNESMCTLYPDGRWKLLAGVRPFPLLRSETGYEPELRLRYFTAYWTWPELSLPGSCLIDLMHTLAEGLFVKMMAILRRNCPEYGDLLDLIDDILVPSIQSIKDFDCRSARSDPDLSE